MEQLQYNLLFRWFVGLSIDEPVWVPTVFTKNRARLLTRRWQCVKDMPTGPRKRVLSLLTVEEDALCIAFRKHALLPLNDRRYALQASLASDSISLHRLFQQAEV